VGRKHSDPGAIGAAQSLALLPLVLITSSSRWETPGNRLSKSLFGRAVWASICITSRCLTNAAALLGALVSLDVFLAGKKHQMHSAEPDQFDKHFGPRQMDRSFRLMH
jgi:hypothetical protein